MTYEALYRAYYAAIERYCLYRVNNPFFAEELASEAFHLLFCKWDTLRSHDAPALLAWLYRTVNRKALELARTQSKVTVSLSEADGVNLLEQALQSGGNAPDGYLENQKYERYLDRIRVHLTPEEWELFQCIVIRRLPYREVGARFHTTEAAVKMRWYRLQRRLRRLVEALIAEG